MSGHLTRRQLESLVADDPHARVPPQHRVHVAGCDPCNVRRLGLQTAQTRYLFAHPVGDFAQLVVERAATTVTAKPPRRRKLQTIAPALGVLAITAVALLWFHPVFPPAASRANSGAALEVFAQHAGVQRPLRDGDALAAGDELAFVYRLDRASHLLLLGVDDAGQIRRYFPSDGDEAALAATSHAQLAVSVELAARKGDERLYALFSDVLLDELAAREAIVRALAEQRARGGGIATMQAIAVAQLESQRTVWFRRP